MNKNKKDFTKNNPAMAYISTVHDNNDKLEIVEQKKTQKVKRTDKETKSERLNLVLQPSLKKDLKKIARMNKRSPNEQICRCLEDLIKDNQDLIKKHDEIFGDIEE